MLTTSYSAVFCVREHDYTMRSLPKSDLTKGFSAALCSLKGHCELHTAQAHKHTVHSEKGYGSTGHYGWPRYTVGYMRTENFNVNPTIEAISCELAWNPIGALSWMDCRL